MRVPAAAYLIVLPIAVFVRRPPKRAYLALEADNSFSIDSMVMEAWPA